ncbi:MAG: type IV pilus twitching motility protein PilT, partial [Pirellulales bacterium]|nr:type IV pilus twitching motility protein PilT [Pirellulales bacterium]
ETVDHHIITIEDPIEFYHYHKKSVINQREVHVDVPSFAEAIKRALRQDPDVILVGELRDLETIEAAITAAETGHVVFGTLHTNSAQKTVDRIIDAFPGNLQDQIRTQLSTCLLGVLAQQLLPKIGGGRIAAYELMVGTSAIQNLIRENKTFRIASSIQTGKKEGMQLMDDHLYTLWETEKCIVDEVLYKAIDKIALAQRINVAIDQGRGPEMDLIDEEEDAFETV